MSEQRVVYKFAETVDELVVLMNGLIGSMREDGMIVESIEHFDVFQYGAVLCAIVLVNTRLALPFIRARMSEEVPEFVDISEYPG